MSKKKNQRQETWSTDMLKEFINLLLYMPGPEINFVIKERVNWITLTNISAEYHSSFRGGLLGFKDVYCGLSSLDSLPEEYQDYMGYIEILNGMSEDGEPVPLIRGFIKKDITFFESVSKMVIESRILNSNELMVLGIRVNVSEFKKDAPPAENILNMKLPIESIQIFKRISFV